MNGIIILVCGLLLLLAIKLLIPVRWQELLHEGGGIDP